MADWMELSDFGRYRMRKALESEMVKLKMKFTDLNPTVEQYVVERDGKIIGLAEVRPAIYIHNIALVDEPPTQRVKSMIAIAKLLQDMSLKSGAAILGFVKKEKLWTRKNGVDKPTAWNKILQYFKATKIRHSSGRIYKYNLMD